MELKDYFRPIPSQVEHSQKYNPAQPAEPFPLTPQTSERRRIDLANTPAELENYLRFTQGY